MPLKSVEDLGHLVRREGRDQACHAGVDSRPIARVVVAAACTEDVVADRHAACLALAGRVSREGRLDWLAKSRDLKAHPS